MTFRLETFGGLSLTDAEGNVRAVQRRRLALLALLACADKRGLSRDQLVAYLWSEGTEESARHSLEQLLYGLRRTIADDVFLGVNPLRLNPAVLEVTVGMFEHALANGAVSDAVALYVGPFLDGFYLNDAPEFEQWSTRERSRLAGRYADALNQLADEAEAKRALEVAVEWRRKLSSLDPLSAPRALGLMRALANAGDSAGALTHARTYEALVRLELDASPDPSIASYARAIREEAATSTARSASRATAAPMPSLPIQLPNASRGPPTAAPLTMPSTVRRRTRLAALAGISVGLTLAAIWALRTAAVSRRDGAVAAEARVAVLPARVIGSDSTIVNLAEGVMDLLAAAFNGDGIPAAVDSRKTMGAWRRATASPEQGFTFENARAVARQVDAATVLLTEVSRPAAGEFRISARLFSVADGAERARADQRGPADSLTYIVDAVLSELLLRQTGDEHLSLATLTSRSLPALTAFLQGRAEHRRGHSAAAIAHFARALAIDTTFALAALELASAHRWTLRWTTRALDTVAQTMPIGAGARSVPTSADRDLWERAMRIAWTGRHRLSVRDRALLDAVAGPRFPRDSYARDFLSAWDRAVRAAPDRADGLYSLGSLLLHQGAAIGLTAPLSRAAASFNRALDFDSSFVAPLAGLLELAAFGRNMAEARRLAPLYFARDFAGAQADYVRWLVAALTDDAAALRSMRARFGSLDLETLTRIQTTSQVAGVAAADADRANDAILRRVGERTQRQIALHNAFWLALNRGRPAKALEVLAQKRDVDPNDDLRLAHTIRGALFGDGDTAAGMESVRILESRIGWPPRSSRRVELGPAQVSQSIFSVALWRLWRGDTTGATEAIALLRSGPPRGGAPELLEALRAQLSQPAAVPVALQRLDSIAMLGCCTLPHFINFVSARVHERVGDLPRALAAIRRGRWLFPPEYLSAYLREEGRLAHLTGDREGAIRAYRHYLVLRADPEAALRPQADSLRREVARLEASR